MARKGGNPDIAKLGEKTQISRQNQPAPPLKSAGWQKKKFTRQIIREFLEGKFDLSPELKKQFQAKFGIDPDTITVGAAVTMQQAMLAMGSGTTAKQAAEFLFNQAYGQPKQEIDMTSEGKPIKQNVIKLSDGTNLSI